MNAWSKPRPKPSPAPGPAPNLGRGKRTEGGEQPSPAPGPSPSLGRGKREPNRPRCYGLWPKGEDCPNCEAEDPETFADCRLDAEVRAERKEKAEAPKGWKTCPKRGYYDREQSACASCWRQEKPLCIEETKRRLESEEMARHAEIERRRAEAAKLQAEASELGLLRRRASIVIFGRELGELSYAERLQLPPGCYEVDAEGKMIAETYRPAGEGAGRVADSFRRRRAGWHEFCDDCRLSARCELERGVHQGARVRVEAEEGHPQIAQITQITQNGQAATNG